MSNDAQWIADIARGEAEKVINNRTIPDFPAYFFEGRWIVTYDWMHDADQALHTRINELEKKVARLSKPWWKLW